MQEREAYFDDRLYTHGIDYVAWEDARQKDQQPRTVTLRFPVENAKPIEIAERVIPNAEESEYQAINLNEELRKRGIRDIRAEVSREPLQSDIYITIEGEPEPLRVTKLY
jgi:hypothetical protein